MEIDVEKLRKDLIDYLGTAMFNVSPVAVMDLTKVEKATPQELINIANFYHFDLTEYQINSKSLF